MTTPRKVLFVSLHDPADVLGWSGTPHFMLDAMRQLAQVDVLVPRRAALVERVGRVLGRLSGSRMPLERMPPVLRSYGRRIERAMARRTYDLVFSPSSLLVAAVATEVPLVFWTDATFKLLTGLYDASSRYARPAVWAAERAEQQSLRAASRAGYSSEWAITDARSYQPTADILLAEFGPNLPAASIEAARRARAARAADGMLRLLWVGSDWHRKGGDVVAAIGTALRTSGRMVEVHVVGPSPHPLPEGVVAHGRLSKAIPADLDELVELYARADVLLLPSRADCTPIVISEAAAVGLPVVVSDVGGLGEMVRRHDIGIVVGSDLDADRYADAVLQVVAQPGRSVATCDTAATQLNYRTSLERLLP